MIIHWLWTSRTMGAQVARAALTPASLLFRIATTVRNGAYDAGLLRSVPLGAPTLSIGNLSVGGTGKTPVAAYLAGECIARGARPGILLRGYGDDEPRVQKLLTPGAIVVADPDRVRGARAAIAQGADVLILDDGFQHRRAQRDADVVLVSADAIGAAHWPLPAGPWRESFRALSRATLAMITVKAAPPSAVDAVGNSIAELSVAPKVGVFRMVPDGLRRWDSAERVTYAPREGARVLVVSAIGDPQAFEAQLMPLVLRLHAVRYPDHHAYSDTDIAAIVKRATGAECVVCTLKDAVKLGPLWPRNAPPLWYLSQQVIVERGEEHLRALVAELVAARRAV